MMPAAATAAGARRVMVLDPGCDSISGHHFAFDAALRARCAELGIPCRVYGSRVRPAVMQRLGGEAHFRTPVYSAQRDEVEVLRRAGVGNKWFLDDLARLPEPGAQTIVIMHTVTHLHLAGLTAWLRQLREKPRLRLTLRYPPDFYIVGGHPPAASLAGVLYRHAIRALADAAPGLRLFSDTAELGRRYARASGVPVEHLPNPVHWPGLADPDAPAGERPSRFLFIGEARMEKGYMLLPEAIRLALAREPRLRFEVHMNRGFPPVDAELAALAQGGAVEFAKALPVADPDYVPKLRSADAVLMAYRPEHYRLRASALVADTLASGRCPIVTSGTSLEAELREFDPLPGVVMREFSAPALAHAMLEFDARRAELRAAAAHAAPAVRERHSPARYLDAHLGEAA